MKTHLLNLALYALLVSVLLSLFWREGSGERVRFALKLAGSMIGIALGVGWILYLIGRP